ncbi:hypothetical protein OCH239_06780 [Roseivivax halodurans JCM 10272]|uniref:DUF4864 domain-containing protein n=1 Tax=Roseivivax halodurans JCM 10272 TaxID=1449350 RepID=X7EF76_9RHOB|nr:DUF4864 domain-containing protein [Roseivivax halodurans]ETX13768.1 hypothetical protein OCH239_06780 [Roseivivax halodurans JCM 10272]
MLRPLIFCIALAVPGLSFAQERATDPEIEAVISGQMQAFRDSDVESAFDFAAPGIQSLFRTPQNFGTMVEQGYPMVWRPGQVSFGELREEAGQLWQEVLVQDSRGIVHVLDYEMREVDGAWRIGGVRILDQQGFAA